MDKYLIEVPHGGDKAWLVVEVEDKESDRRLLPSGYRIDAKIVKINKFSRKDIDSAILDHHSRQTGVSRPYHHTSIWSPIEIPWFWSANEPAATWPMNESDHFA